MRLVDSANCRLLIVMLVCRIVREAVLFLLIFKKAKENENKRRNKRISIRKYKTFKR